MFSVPPRNKRLAWLKMRRGIADLHRRAEVSQSANEQYLNALSRVDDSERLQELIEPLEQPAQWKGERVPRCIPSRPTIAFYWKR